MKTAELEGADLDMFVAKAEGYDVSVDNLPLVNPIKRIHISLDGKYIWFKPSTDWSQGGPLIQKYEIMNDGYLVGAMRELVRRKFGDEVE